jgi:NHL/RHS/YD repeat protein
MQGMNIGFFNHAMHDVPPSVSTQQNDQDLPNMLPKVVVTAKRISVETLITKIVYTGALVNKYRSQGTYTMYYGTKQVFSCNAVSGASNCKSYTIPSGDGNVVSISDRSEARFTSNGVGFTANLDPDPFYDSRVGRNRQYIRIHPARSNGTNGCIGLRANKAQLIRARDLIRNSLKKGLTIKLYVQIGGN